MWLSEGKLEPWLTFIATDEGLLLRSSPLDICKLLFGGTEEGRSFGLNTLEGWLLSGAMEGGPWSGGGALERGPWSGAGAIEGGLWSGGGAIDGGFRLGGGAIDGGFWFGGANDAGPGGSNCGGGMDGFGTRFWPGEVWFGGGKGVPWVFEVVVDIFFPGIKPNPSMGCLGSS